MLFSQKKLTLPNAAEALTGRNTPLCTPEPHFVTGKPIAPPFPAALQTAIFALGCFWGAERFFGNKQVYLVQQWAIPEVSPQTLLIKSFVRV